MLFDDVEKRIRTLEIYTRKLVQSTFHGEYTSFYKGQGLTFSEVCKYIPGDDVRNIDRNVSARMGEPYIKIFEEERDCTLFLLVDVSASTLFGENKVTIREAIQNIAGVLALSAAKSKDKIGLVLFSDKIEYFIPPKKGLAHGMRILKDLFSFEPKQTKTDLQNSFTFLNKVARKHTIVFCISDFLTPFDSKNIQIVGRKYDFTALDVSLKIAISNVGLVRCQDLESGEEIYIDSNQMQSYHFIIDQHKKEQKKIFLNASCGYTHLNIKEDYLHQLGIYLRSKALR